MSRLKQFTRSLVSGYAVLLANVLFTLASVPLALHYLTPEQFGLWMLVAQIGGYLGLIDLGMGGVARILIDYKDEKTDGRYGSAVRTTVVVSVVQAAIIVGLGFLLALCLGPLLDIPPQLRDAFAVLTFGQAVLLAANFLTRIFYYMLSAHQRYDVANYAQIVSFVVHIATLWVAFQNGAGLFSTLWAQAGVWIVLLISWGGACWRLHLLPPRESGRATWASFLEIFRFGRDVFLVQAGNQLVNASQAILLARLIGLEAVSLWSICTRAITLMSQFVFRIFDYSCAALAEMYVREETQRLQQRFRDIVIVSCSVAVFLAAAFVVCNQSFVALWTQGKFGWPRGYDVLAAAIFLASVLSRIHIGLTGQTKLFHAARYIYLLEGAFFILLSLIVVPQFGIAGMMSASLASVVAFSGGYGIWRTSQQFGISVREVLVGWMQNALKLSVRLVPLALVLVFFLRPLVPLAQFLIGAAVMSLGGGWWLLRVGFPETIRREGFALLSKNKRQVPES
jgi:O-antigen/teichoic acid export membrane protein